MTKNWGTISRSEFQSHYTIELMKILSFQSYHNSDIYSLNQHHVRCTNTVIEIYIFTQIFLRLSCHASVISRRRPVCCLSLSFIQILVWMSIKWMNHILTYFPYYISVIDCGILNSTVIPGSDVDTTFSGGGQDTTYGATFTFGCLNNLTVQGQSSLGGQLVTCSDTGLWDLGSLHCGGKLALRSARKVSKRPTILFGHRKCTFVIIIAN